MFKRPFSGWFNWVVLMALVFTFAQPGHAYGAQPGDKPANKAFSAVSWHLFEPAQTGVEPYIASIMTPARAQSPSSVIGTGTPANCNDAALNAALASGGTITFNCGAAPITILVTLKNLTQTVTIDGGNVVTLSGSFANSLFSVPATVTLTLNNLTLLDGSASDQGGAIQNHGTLVVNHSTLQDNVSNANGGAIFNSGAATITQSIFSGDSGLSTGGGLYNIGTATLSGNTFLGNYATMGGGIYNAGTATLTGDAFLSNIVDSAGGGIANISGTLSLTGVHFESNSTTTAGSGGGLYNSSGQATLTNVTLNDNSAQLYGGAIANFQLTSTLVMSGTTLTGNLVSANGASGGGIFNDHSTVIVTNTIFVTNTSISDFVSGLGGGGFYNNSGVATMANVAFVSNTANYDGGAIVNHAGAMTITHSLLVSNTARYGGGIENQSNGAMLLLVDSTLRANQAYTTYFGGTGNGGGIDNFLGAVATLNRVTLNNNFSEAGGGLFNDSATMTVMNSTLSSNSAAYGGGGLYRYLGSVSLTYVTISSNTATYGGGLAITIGTPVTLTDVLLVHGGTGGNCSPVGTIVSADHNLSDDTTCNAYLTKSNDQKNVSAQLGALADNGGPTFTHMPAAASLAVNHGGLSCPVTDQRGVYRYQSSACDIGAVERGTLFVASHWTFMPLLRK